MSSILEQIEPTSISAVIEANINTYLLSFARIPGATLHDDAASTWVDSGLKSANYNSIVRAHFDPNMVDTQVEATLAHFKQHQRPVTWHIGPTSTPPDLAHALVAHGMTHSEDEPGMALDLTNVSDAVHPIPDGLTIVEVRDERGLRDWVDVWLFPVPPAARQTPFEALHARGIGADLPWRYYVGYLDGRPVATSELFVAEGVSAVHYVVTRSEYRRRGIGAAMTLHVLHAARDLGYRVAVLTASPDGHDTYRRIGFQDYCMFSRYEWEPNETV